LGFFAIAELAFLEQRYRTPPKKSKVQEACLSRNHTILTRKNLVDCAPYKTDGFLRIDTGVPSTQLNNPI
jgi:hypothetical protein